MKFENIEYAFSNRYLDIEDYEHLIIALKALQIGPQEAFDLIYKNKFQFNARYYWTMIRIGLYLTKRYRVLLRNYYKYEYEFQLNLS